MIKKRERHVPAWRRPSIPASRTCLPAIPVQTVSQPETVQSLTRQALCPGSDLRGEIRRQQHRQHGLLIMQPVPDHRLTLTRGDFLYREQTQGIDGPDELTAGSPRILITDQERHFVFTYQLKGAALHAGYDQHQQHRHHEHKDHPELIPSQYPHIF